MRKLLPLFLGCLTTFCAFSQGAVEGILIEEYFSADSFGSIVPSWQGEQAVKTYRIYVDLAPGYKLQAVFGNSAHPLKLGSTGIIFNQPERGFNTGNWLNARKFNWEALILDSFVTIGTVSNSYAGVMLSEDSDGSILPELGEGDVVNQHLVKANLAGNLPAIDGLMRAYPNNVQLVRMEIPELADVSSVEDVETSDGCWAVLGGVEGPTPSNKVLIAQITTDGELFFELNLQVGLPSGGSEQYVAGNAKGNEVYLPALNFPLPN